METITKIEMERMGIAIDRALKEVARDFGVVLKLGNGTYSNTNASYKLKVSTIGADGTVLTKEAIDYGVACSRDADYKIHGGVLKKNWLNKTKLYRGKKVKLVGASSRARKRPFILMEDGQEFRCSATLLATIFGK